MHCEFLHIADAHLGYQQYGQRERFNDFGRAFMHAMDYACDTQPVFVCISGDLFHKSTVDPLTLLQAMDGLQKLRDAGIPAVAVEGNHDRPRYRDESSWLGLLDALGYLILLRPGYDNGRPVLAPYESGKGAYADIQGVRVYGLPYLGAAARPVLEALPEAMAAQPAEGIAYTVLLAHLGLEGEMPGVPGGLPHAVLAPLRPYVDYLALGHWHKPFDREGWIYNPGSLEACAVSESQWAGGFYHVSVDTEAAPRHEVRHVDSPRRPFVRIPVAADGCASPADLFEAVRQALIPHQRAESERLADPVVELTLEGVLPFDRSALDLAAVEQLARDLLKPLVVLSRDHTRAVEFEIEPGEDRTRSEVERQVLLDLVRRDARYQAQAEAWAALMMEIKAMALAQSAPEVIVEAMTTRLREMESA